MFARWSKRVLSKNIRHDETIIKVLRSHPIKHFWGSLFIFLLILAPLFFMIPLVALGQWGVVILFSSVGLGILLLARLLYVWYLHAFIITTQRVIDHDQRGILFRTVSACRFDKIQDVRYTKKGLVSMLFGIGDIVIQTAGEDVAIELDSVNDPEDVHNLIVDQQAKYQQLAESDDMSAAELIGYVRQSRRSG